ncbi:phospholipid-transporting ATPase VA isoform X2 [Hydra vulgaris]|uniref:Phospholipid-transporting ATPase n=1 Tax=Hydra vulgaris TaxID=6087 RepID=A0ABM4D3S0_HYDVU
MYWRKFSPPATLSSNDWTVEPRVSKTIVNKHEHRGNKIKTTKYTILTFIPKNLFEQFHRFANVYFLFIIILNWIPQVNAFGKEIAMFPLIFVLAVTALKDIFEDRQRYLSDKMVNNYICSVYESEEAKFVSSKWKDVCVGDIIELTSDSLIPADMLLLYSSDENGLCHISTANLDGETNLKQKEIPKGFLENDKQFSVRNIDFKVKCEKPNNILHNFCGSILYKNGKETGVDGNHLLLRGCVVKNTASVIGLVLYAGHDTKVMLNNSSPRYKRSRLEKDINKDVIGCVFILFVFCTAGAIGCSVWAKEYNLFETIFSTDKSEKPSYEGFLRFWTFIIVLQVIIPISLYVSVEIVKLGQVYFINNDKEMFYEKTAQYPICRATNINEDLGQIQYVFSDKTGTLTENKMVFKKFSIGGVLGTHNSGLNNEGESLCKRDAEMLLANKDSTFLNIWDEFFTVLTICNTVVVSSQPSLPTETNSKSYFIKSESKRRFSSSIIQRSSINSNGKLKRAQTLPDVTVDQSIDDIAEEDSIELNDYLHVTRRVRIFSKVISDRLSRSIDSINSWLDCGLTPTYEFESPDEGALVKAASLYGYKLANRTPEQIFFATPSGEIKVFDILHILQFDSQRKRMSVIVRDDAGLIKVYSKGADSAFLNFLKEGQEDIQTVTDQHLEEFAKEGLRTLCIAKKDLTTEQYNIWLEKRHLAERSLTNRHTLLASSAELIETDFQLLGATAIEDRLQDGVPETIANLRYAGIKVWILTGDKQETAVNIGFSSKLIDSSMEIITLNSKSKEECNELLEQIQQRISTTWPENSVVIKHPRGNINTGRPPLALIVDGVTLTFALEKPLDKKFVEIARYCESVICCRAAPLQKAAVVSLIRENLKVMSLAIGDGANDVSMLQMAEIGVGIAGEEGVQAVMASDFVLGRFRFLQRLLLLHGFWCYDRTARMIVYFFYKNAMFVSLLFWYQLYNGFSGSNAIDDISLILFNLIFTSLPPIISGIFDQSLNAEAVIKRPLLYQWGQFGKGYSRKLFWISVLDAVYQSLVLYFITMYSYFDLPFGMLVVGITYHQLAVLTVSLHIAVETPNWTWIHGVVIFGSASISYIYFLIFCAIDPLINIYWGVYEVMSSSQFWLLSFICPIIALLPRLVYRAFANTLRPSIIQLVRKK